MKHLFFYTVPLLFLCMQLSGCGYNGPLRYSEYTEAREETPLSIVDPDDEILMQAITKHIETGDAPASSRYEFTRTDLNEDGRRDALVLFKTPYGYWCESNGCTMLVMEAHNDGFHLVNAIHPVRGPLYISENATNGWRDIAIRVSGRQSKAKDVIMKFDGSSYPDSPDAQSPALRLASGEALKVFP